jgi:hypothetical protein
MNEKTQGGVPRSIAHVVSSTSRTLKHALKQLRHWIESTTQQRNDRDTPWTDVPRNPPPGEPDSGCPDGQAAATSDKAGAL